MKFQKSFTFTLLSRRYCNPAAGCTAQAETASAKVAAAPQQIAYIKNCKVVHAL